MRSSWRLCETFADGDNTNDHPFHVHTQRATNHKLVAVMINRFIFLSHLMSLSGDRYKTNGFRFMGKFICRHRMLARHNVLCRVSSCVAGSLLPTCWQFAVCNCFIFVILRTCLVVWWLHTLYARPYLYQRCDIPPVLSNSFVCNDHADKTKLSVEQLLQAVCVESPVNSIWCVKVSRQCDFGPCHLLLQLLQIQPALPSCRSYMLPVSTIPIVWHVQYMRYATYGHKFQNDVSQQIDKQTSHPT